MLISSQNLQKRNRDELCSEKLIFFSHPEEGFYFHKES